MYANTSFKTKKALKEAVAEGRQIGVYQPGPFGGNEPTNGTCAIEGPNNVMHTWYATVTLVDGIITKVK
jgi:hypothetical protein